MTENTPKYYHIIRSILAMQVSSSTKVVWLYLWDRQGKKETCWPSLTTIGRDCNLSKGTVIKTLGELQENDVLEIKHPAHPSKKNKASNAYTVLLTGLKIEPVYELNRSNSCTSTGAETEPQPVQKLNPNVTHKNVLNNEPNAKVVFEDSRKAPSSGGDAPPLGEYWNSKANLPTIRKLTPQRQAKLKARMMEPEFAGNWKEIIDRVAASSFCIGQNDRGWKADVDWILKNSTNYVKVLEGKYTNKHQDNEPDFASAMDKYTAPATPEKIAELQREGLLV